MSKAQSQARKGAKVHALPVAKPEAPEEATMIYWLAQAAKHTRQEAGVKQLDIASAAGVGDQSTIYRFEQGQRYPGKVDVIIAAYAEECGVSDPRGIWELATTLWRTHGVMPTVTVLTGGDPAPQTGDALEAARRAFEQSLAGESPARRPRRVRPAESSGAKQTG